MQERDEFYVGYLPKAPQGLGRLARSVGITLLIAAAVVAVALVFGQQRLAKSLFEFGTVREFEGVISEYPYPVLITRKAEDGKQPILSTYALVAPGKHGADELIAGFDARRVKLRGTLIQRDNQSMIELIPDSVRAFKETGELPHRRIENLGLQTLRGEIVDSKCYLGVMNPGHTKPHRECASLCIRGGVPPLFIVRDATGRSAVLWLVSDKGQPVNQQVLDFVAEPVEITGQIARQGDQLYLRADPKSYRRMR